MHISDVAWRGLAKIGEDEMTGYIAGVVILAIIATVIVAGIFVFGHHGADDTTLHDQLKLFKETNKLGP